MGGAAAVGAAPVWAQGGLAATELAGKVSLISGAGNNIVALVGGGGVLLVDSGDEAHGAEVLRVAGAAAGSKVSTVINTHWHVESTGGNEAMARAGAKVVAHLNTQLWMTQEIIQDWSNRMYAPRAQAAQPTETFATAGKMSFAGEPVEYGLMPMAHTDGDIYVYLPESNVLAVGDAVQPGRLPLLDWFCGGWIGGMQEAHRTVLRLANETTKIVPAVGPVVTKGQVQANLDLLTKVRETLVKLMKQGKGARDMMNAKAVQEFQGQLAGDADTFIYTAYRGLWAHARELGGIV
jgi:cyclase